MNHKRLPQDTPSDEANTILREQSAGQSTKESGTRDAPRSPADRALRETRAIQSALQNGFDEDTAIVGLQGLRIQEQRLEDALEALLAASSAQQDQAERAKLIETLQVVRRAIRDIQNRLPHEREEPTLAPRTVARPGADPTHVDAIRRAAESGDLSRDQRRHKRDIFALRLKQRPASHPSVLEPKEEDTETARIRELINTLEEEGDAEEPSGTRSRKPSVEHPSGTRAKEIASIERAQQRLEKKILKKYGKKPQDLVRANDAIVVTHNAFHALMGTKSDLQEWRELEEVREALLNNQAA